jgi:hypothetical protein
MIPLFGPPGGRRAKRAHWAGVPGLVAGGLLLLLPGPSLAKGETVPSGGAAAGLSQALSDTLPSPAAPPVEAVYRGFSKFISLSDLGWEQGVGFSGTSIDRTAFFGVPPSQIVEKGSITLHYRYTIKPGTPVHPRIEVDSGRSPIPPTFGPPPGTRPSHSSSPPISSPPKIRSGSAWPRIPATPATTCTSALLPKSVPPVPCP